MGSAGAAKELASAPDLPVGLEYIWHWFQRLNATRQGGMSGKSAITETEIGWFFRNRGITPAAWEIELIVLLDLMAMNAD